MRSVALAALVVTAAACGSPAPAHPAPVGEGARRAHHLDGAAMGGPAPARERALARTSPTTRARVSRSRPRTSAAPRVEAGGNVVTTIHAVFGAEGPAAVRVARCESGLNPRAVSPGGQNLGVLQINVVHRRRWEAMGYTRADMLTVGPNVRVAYAIWSEGRDWHQWACRWAA